MSAVCALYISGRADRWYGCSSGRICVHLTVARVLPRADSKMVILRIV